MKVRTKSRYILNPLLYVRSPYLTTYKRIYLYRFGGEVTHIHLSARAERVEIKAFRLASLPQRIGFTNPTIIIEILSPSTEPYDRGDKFAAYCQITSLQSYVLVSQLEARIEIYNRQGDGWHFSEVIGFDKTLRLESIQYPLNLAEIYQKAD